MEFEDIIIEHPQDSLSQDLVIAKFKTYAKDQFQDFALQEIDYLQYIKRSAQLFAYKLGEDKSEIFIYYDAAPYFWLCDIPAVLKAEELFRSENKSKISVHENYKILKDFYAKWAILKSEQEKKYYALSSINIIEKDSANVNFLRTILHAVILIYDKKIFSPDRAIELLHDAYQILNEQKLADQYRSTLGYIICIFSAFAYLKKSAYLEANQMLNEALVINPAGLTAKFYLALTNKKIGDRESAVSLLNEIVDYDRNAIRFAVSNNSISFLVFTAQNAVTYNIFRENEFADLLEEIETVINTARGIDDFSFENLGSLMIRFSDLRLSEYYNEEIVKTIEFLESVYQSFIGNRNAIISFSKPFLREKMNHLGEMVLNVIKEKYQSEIRDKLWQYDLGVQENQEAIKHLTKEIEEVKKQQAKRLEDYLAELDNQINYNISSVEYRIENFQNERRYNPQATFNNSMVYNIIITLMVFIIGGFVGCYGNTVSDAGDFKESMGTVVGSGLKWSTVTFLLGVIISMFSAAFTFMEKMNEKQRLLKKITYIKAYKEKEVESIKKDNERKTKSLIDSFNDRIQEHKKHSDVLVDEKQSRLIDLQADADRKTKEFESKINSVLY